MLIWNFKFIRFPNSDSFYNFMPLGPEQNMLEILFSLSRNIPFHLEYTDQIWIVINQHSLAKFIFLDEESFNHFTSDHYFYHFALPQTFPDIMAKSHSMSLILQKLLNPLWLFYIFCGWCANQRTINGNNQSWFLLIQILKTCMDFQLCPLYLTDIIACFSKEFFYVQTSWLK